MFGRLRGYYLKSDKSTLDLYHEFYCGSCYALSDKYGAVGRIVLSYEFTASLALVHSITTDEIKSIPLKCPLKGIGKRNRVLFENEWLDDLIALYIYLLSLKLRDDIEDEGWLRRVPASLFKRKFGNEMESIEKRLSHYGLDSAYMKSLVTERNTSKHEWLDESLMKSGEIFSETGKMIARLADREDLKDSLSQLGSSLGMCIDLIDMMEDLKSDYSSGKNNPIIHIYGKNCRNVKEIFSNAKTDLDYLAKQLSCDLAISLKNIKFSSNDELIKGIFGRPVEMAFAKALGRTHRVCPNMREVSV